MAGKTRESNIELLRILTICGVVVLHYNGNVAFSHVAAGSANFYLLTALEGLFICAVDLFVLISGYFLVGTTKRRGVKALELVVQVMVMGAVKYLVTCLLGSNGLSLRSLVGAVIPNNYFVTLYLTVYLLSPYFNIALEKLTDRQYGVLVLMGVCLFSVWPTLLDTLGEATGYVLNGLYTTGSGGSQYGYSLINFALMYLIGGYLRRLSARNWSPKGWVCGLLLALCVGVLFFWQLWFPGIARAYCNPLVIAEAVLLFVLFGKLRFESRIVNILAKGAFTCFLVHDLFLWYIGIERVVNGSTALLLVHLTASVILIFLACWCVWRVYHWVTAHIFRWIGGKLGRLDRLISLEKGQEET